MLTATLAGAWPTTLTPGWWPDAFWAITSVWLVALPFVQHLQLFATRREGTFDVHHHMHALNEGTFDVHHHVHVLHFTFSI